MVDVYLGRDSVHAGDDCESHDETWTFPDSATVDDLLVAVADGYIARVAAKVTWYVSLQRRADHTLDRALAVIYAEDGLNQSPSFRRVTRLWNGEQRLARLTALRIESILDVYVHYLHSGPRLATPEQMRSSESYTGAAPSRLKVHRNP